MTIRRRGISFDFWGTDETTFEPTGTNGTSRAVYLGQAVDQIAIYLQVDNNTTITVQCAHSIAQTSDGVNPDTENPPTVWGDLYYANQANPVTFAFSAGGSQTRVIILNDFTPGWIRLKSSGNINAIAGWEAVSY